MPNDSAPDVAAGSIDLPVTGPFYSDGGGPVAATSMLAEWTALADSVNARTAESLQALVPDVPTGMLDAVRAGKRLECVVGTGVAAEKREALATLGLRVRSSLFLPTGTGYLTMPMADLLADAYNEHVLKPFGVATFGSADFAPLLAYESAPHYPRSMYPTWDGMQAAPYESVPFLSAAPAGYKATIRFDKGPPVVCAVDSWFPRARSTPIGAPPARAATGTIRFATGAWAAWLNVARDPLRNSPHCSCGNQTNRKRRGAWWCFDCWPTERRA